MYKTIEAIYKDGSVFPLKDEIPVKYARILITILEEQAAKPKSHSLKDFIGKGKGAFDRPEDADTFIRTERDLWEKP
ncbi:hypothetical protein [Desulfonema limicola]|uniref:hypothetical protein n=1 Tax=Desulfonema limicola TaxID=45656 RepID=UPI001A9B0E35|nr:hypothetical protein [Desulfonema limicola]